MEGLCSPWGLPPPAYNMSFSESRSRYASTLEIRNTCPTTAQQDLLPRRQRSPSLPPILRSQGTADSNYSEYMGSHDTMKYPKKEYSGKPTNNIKYRYEDGEGETSGYASECAPQSSPELKQSRQQTKTPLGSSKSEMNLNYSENGTPNRPIAAWQCNERRSSEDKFKQREREEEVRPRWGDRGVAVGRLWEPQDADSRLPQMLPKGTPSWVERGLNMMDSMRPQILVLDQMNDSSTIESLDGKSGSNFEKCTYLLGQNVPIEPNIKAERECKRLKALELQAAIVQQLEERERKKREEKDRRIREEQEEEERFKRQRELERQRLQEERRMAEEKQHREQKRAEALRLALEKAEQQAKLEKENKKIKRLKDSFDSMSINSEIDPPKDPNQNSDKSVSQQSTPFKESKLIQNIYIEQAFSPRRKFITEQENTSRKTPSLSGETNIIMSNPQSARYSHQYESFNHDQQLMDINKRPENIRQHSENTNTSQSNYQGNLTEAPVSLVPIPMTHEMFTPVHIAQGTGIQMAFLMPQPMNALYQCMHQSVPMQAIFPPDSAFSHQRSSFPTQSQTDTDESCINREHRVLTPSKYRNPNYKDVSTQTDFEFSAISNRVNLSDEKESNTIKSLDQTYEQNTSEEKLNSLTLKKDKRLQSEEKYKDLESRPKWGVNKPPTQYKKQSEKDIFYPQKRKLRSRKRIQEKQYTSHSSDENRSPSPLRESAKHYQKLDRNRISLTESYWRKRGIKTEKSASIGNISVETTEISALECDKSGLVRISESSNFLNEKKIYTETKSMPKKTLTLSQKFMNDKYGNPKLWNGNSTESILPDARIHLKRDSKDDQSIKFKDKLDQRKQFLDSVNRAKREQSAYYCDDEPSQPVILDQLRSLRDSLQKQQQIWGKYDSNNRSPSPKNEVDLEIE